MSKRLSAHLRHGDLPREDDGAIEFWRIKDYLRNDLERSQHWSDEKWKSRMTGGGGVDWYNETCTGILSHLLRKSHNSKLIFEWKEYLKMLSYKMKKR